MKLLDDISDSMDISLDKIHDREGCRAVVHGVTKDRTGLSHCTELN